jgi:hypothetical protein
LNQVSRSLARTEVFLPLPVPRDKVPPATEFRSTWLSSSLLALREHGYFERYLGILPREYHDPILNSVAGVWLPIEIAVAHYRASQQLNLSRAEYSILALDVTRRVHGTSLALAIRLAKQVGVNPWTSFAQLERLWERVWRGGAVTVHKSGPKEAIVEIVNWRCAEITYVRQTVPFVVLALTELFCTKAYTSEATQLWSPTSMGIRVAWV